MTLTTFLGRSSSLPFACFAYSRHHIGNCCSPLNNGNNNNYTSKTNMVKYTKDDDEAIKDQLREGYYKGVSDHPVDDFMPHILNLYASCAIPRDFEIYAQDATFEDPLMSAHGINQIKSAFYSLGKVFSESRIMEYRVEEHVISPGKKEILIDSKQYYKFFGKDINMVSLIKLNIENGKIIRHEDWWDKKPLWNRDTVKVPLVGRMTEVFRRGSMLTTHALMGCGKDPTMK